MTCSTMPSQISFSEFRFHLKCGKSDAGSQYKKVNTEKYIFENTNNLTAQK